jgi:sulfur carrier protein
MHSTIRINGEQASLNVATVDELLRSKNINPESRGFAIALNGTVLPRRAWADTTLSHGDTVEIVKAFAGG